MEHGREDEEKPVRDGVFNGRVEGQPGEGVPKKKNVPKRIRPLLRGRTNESEGIEIKTRSYVVTVTDKRTGKSMTITLSEGLSKWVVKADGFQGHYKSLETAMNEGLAHLRSKMEGSFE